jgi:predicted dehydrogenase
MSELPEIRVAIVGCGEISRAHLNALGEANGVSVAGVYDRDAARAAARAQEFGIERVYGAWQELLDDRGADVVAVLLPHDAHCQVSIEALEAGHHVVCEKPMATTMEECDRMLAAAQRAGKLLFPVHNRLYDLATEAVKEFIDGGAIGEVFLAQTIGLEPPRTVSVRPWLGTKAGGGGVLLAQAIHPGYVLRWVLGDLAEVTGITSARKVVDMTAEDTALALLRFQSGAVAEMTATFGIKVGPYEHGITFYGPDGYAEISSRRGVVGISQGRFGDRDPRPLVAEGQDWRRGFVGLWEDYARGIATGAPTRVTAEDGKRAVEMILAAYASADARRTVTLPLA